MDNELIEAYAELQAASLERAKVARQQDINARKEIAARKRWLTAKDRVWALEQDLSREITTKLLCSKLIQPPTLSVIQPKHLKRITAKCDCPEETTFAVRSER